VAVLRHRSREDREVDLGLGMADLVGELSRKAARRKSLSERRAADLVFVYLGPEPYRTLVLECGWSIADWSRWVERAILRDLFDIRT
jgi:hypothetical protein